MMKVTVLVEPLAEQIYRASGGAPFGGSVEAESPEAAVAKLGESIRMRLAQGGRIAVLDVPADGNFWLAGAGMFRDDPLFDDWQQVIRDNRHEADLDPHAP